MTFRNSTGVLEGRFSGRKCLLANLQDTFMENRDHSDPRTPQDVRETLKKPRSQVLRSPPGQQSSVGDDEPTIPREAKGLPKQTLRCTKSNRGTGTLNSTPDVRTGQNRLSRRQAARTFVHVAYGDIGFTQILFVRAFQIY
ncbi:hypothetical protein CDL15_Pgr019149 [Punica granatum]|uniref:Uncharacterized protein n=1 Tax=Punica granatum TaxID=22663 RepID=A0A218X5R5_PUNGR|nr:hypothetical protein CDL15_Pgr019149 [Punica granatum]